MLHPPHACPVLTGSSPPPRPVTAWTAWPLPPPSSASWLGQLKAPPQAPEAVACLGRKLGGPVHRGACRTAGARDRWMLGRDLVRQWLQASVHTPRRTQRGSLVADGTRWGPEGLMGVEAAEASSRYSCSLFFSLFLT